ncbi:hypothetical protein JG725_06570 [Brenneria sp. L3-3C-1]|nr:hypothetical protein [Brenneria sp. L3-3C-1]NPD00999.1 hypothetical protein [Brenneria sp. hezel4-2-4]
MAIGILSLLIVLFAVLFSSQHTIWPFKCSAFTRYNLSQDDNHLEFYLAQDLRFQDKNSGYFLLNGRAIHNENITVLNRTLHLGQGGKIDSDTFRYQINDIVASPTDNTPDALFNQLLAELIIDNRTLQLDVIPIQDKSYLIGGPISYLFTCTTY